MLAKHEITISMTQSGDPLDNAIAERVNGIIKTEYLDHRRATSLDEARAYLVAAVHLYNADRQHLSRTCKHQPMFTMEEQSSPHDDLEASFQTTNIGRHYFTRH
ncbi:MAG: transposase [Ignavibacteria bacterium]|nr:transposase [Ignavibacteria bacterium]